MTDIVDKRRYLIGVEIAILVVSAIFARLVTLDRVTAPVLLAFMFAAATGSAPWGEIAVPLGLPIATARGIGALAGIPLTRRAHLQTTAGLDLSPSMRKAPVVYNADPLGSSS
ncbi:MAG TPA: hypothetical protein VF304_11200 [Casimicrobiaceae bacterium]